MLKHLSIRFLLYVSCSCFSFTSYAMRTNQNELRDVDDNQNPPLSSSPKEGAKEEARSSSVGSLPQRDSLTQRILETPDLNAERDVVYDTKTLMHALQGDVPDVFRPDLTKLLACLYPPEELIYWPKAQSASGLVEGTLTPDHLIFRGILEVIKGIQALQVKDACPPALKIALKEVATFYQNYVTCVCEARLGDRPFLLERKVQMSGETFGVYRISQATAQQMISRSLFNKRVREKQAFGQHDVKPLGGVHFKRLASLSMGLEDPSFPGIEYAVYSLSQRLGFSCIAPSMIITLDGVKTLELPEVDSLPLEEQEAFSSLTQDFNLQNAIGKDPEEVLASHVTLRKGLDQYFKMAYRSHILQASLSIEGINAQEEIDKHQGQLQNIEEENLGQQFILSLLSYPEDAKPDNYILASSLGKRRIIGIDNDHAFTHPIVRSGKGSFYAGVKCLFYCLDSLVNSPFTPSLRQFFCTHDPLHLSFSWAQDLEEQNERYQHLQRRQMQLLAAHEPSAQTFNKLAHLLNQIYEQQLRLPLKLLPGTFQKVLNHLTFLQKASRSSLPLTYGQLFEQTEPLLAAYYERLRHFFPHNLLTIMNTLYQQMGSDNLPLEVLLLQHPSYSLWGASQKLDKDLAPYTAGPFDYAENRSQSLQDTGKELLDAIGPAKASYLSLIRTKAPAYALASLLKTGGDTINAQDTDGNTALHLAVRHAQYAKEEGMRYLKVLLKGAPDRSLKNAEAKTPLDLALETCLPEAVIELVRAGFGHTVHLRSGVNFYQTLQAAWAPALEEAWQHLENLNPELQWKIALKTLFSSTCSSTEIEGLTYGKGFLHPFQEKRFSRSKLPQDNPLFKSSRVSDTTQESQGFSLGRYHFHDTLPPFPGLQIALHHFFTLSVGHGTTPIELFWITAPARRGPFAASLPRQGDSLERVITESPVVLDKLDQKDVEELLLVSMVLNLHTPHTASYRAYPLVDTQRYGLSLLEAPLGLLTDAATPFSVLYCLDMMQQPLAFETRQRLQAFDVPHLLHRWLSCLKADEKRTQDLLSQDNRKGIARESLELYVPLTPGTLTQLYHKLVTLQQLLSQESRTPLDILQRLSPLTGEVISRLFEVHPQKGSLRARLKDLKALEEPLPPAFPWQDLTAAFEELEKVRQHHQTFQNVIQDLEKGSIERFKTLDESWRKQVLMQLDCGKLPVQPQKSFLKGLTQLSLSTLVLQKSEALEDTLLKAILKNSPHLMHLEITDSSQLTPNGFQSIDQLSQLETLVLQGSSIKSFEKGTLFSSLFVLPKLVTLNLARNSHLNKIQVDAPHLRHLVLDENPQLKGDQILIKAPELSQVSLQKCLQLTSPESESLCQRFPKLTFLKVSGCPLLPYADLRSADLTYPWKLLSQADVALETPLLRLLRNEVRVLNLIAMNLSDRHMPIFAEAFKRNTSLQELSLQNNHIGSRGAKVLSDALKTRKTPTKILDLSLNQIESEGAQAVGGMLSQVPLQTLSLSSNPLGNSGLQAFNQAIASHPFLTTLSLNDCLIRKSGVQEMVALLRKLPNLKHLELGRNQLEDAGTIALAEELKNHQSLTDLDLHSNNISALGGKALAQVIANSKIFCCLNLSFRAIDSQDKTLIEKALKRNRNLLACQNVLEEK